MLLAKSLREPLYTVGVKMLIIANIERCVIHQRKYTLFGEQLKETIWILCAPMFEDMHFHLDLTPLIHYTNINCAKLLSEDLFIPGNDDH